MADFFAELEKALDGLEYPSESDAPFDVIRWDGNRLSVRETLVAKTGKGDIQEVTIDRFFAELKETSDSARFTQLKGVLERGLADAQVFRSGEINVDVYVIGRTRTGEIAGVHTTSVET